MTLTRLIRLAAELLYPPRCVLCQDIIPFHAPRGFCQKCRENPDIIPEPFCPKCGAPIEYEGTCDGCERLAPRVFDLNRSVFAYKSPVSDSVHRMKYAGRSDYARAFGKLMAELIPGYFSRAEISFDAVVPVPLHESRLAERGYNQAGLLAEEISKATGIPLVNLLTRVRHTEAQYNLNPSQRRANLAGAFVVNLGGDENIPYKNILLVDDIFTTGSTLNECSAVLRNRGAAFVGTYTFSMAVRHHTVDKFSQI